MATNTTDLILKDINLVENISASINEILQHNPSNSSKLLETVVIRQLWTMKLMFIHLKDLLELKETIKERKTEDAEFRRVFGHCITAAEYCISHLRFLASHFAFADFRNKHGFLKSTGMLQVNLLKYYKAVQANLGDSFDVEHVCI